MTRTFVILEISEAAYREISAKLRAAGYDYAFIPKTITNHHILDMHGIALVPEKVQRSTPVKVTLAYLETLAMERANADDLDIGKAEYTFADNCTLSVRMRSGTARYILTAPLGSAFEETRETAAEHFDGRHDKA